MSVLDKLMVLSFPSELRIGEGADACNGSRGSHMLACDA